MSSLLQYPYSLPVRPISDKGMGVVDTDQLFEEYVDTNLLQRFNDSAFDRINSEVAHLFSIPSLNEADSCSTSLRLDWGVEAAWQQALQKCEQNLALSPKSFDIYFEDKSKEVSGYSGSVGFENCSEQGGSQPRSISLPPISRPQTVRSTKKDMLSMGRPSSSGVRKALSKSASSSLRKTMQQSYYQCPMPEVWAHMIETPADSFILHSSPDTTQSTPLLSRVELLNKFPLQNSPPCVHAQSTSMDYCNPTSPGVCFPGYGLARQASPAMSLFGTEENNDSYSSNFGLSSSSSASNQAHSALQAPPSSLQVCTTAWASNTAETMNFSSSASPEQSTTEAVGWWNNDAVRPTKQKTSYNNAPMAGLGIACSTTSSGSFSTGVIVSNEPPSCTLDLRYMCIYSMSPQQHSPVPFTARRSSRSCSPRRRRRYSRSYRSQSSSCQTSGNVDFVNLTPDDSLKLLTGVAPSGSSKTKARREKEEAERRRKLSQAAMKAIMEAGGDVGNLMRLEREGLFGLES